MLFVPYRLISYTLSEDSDSLTVAGHSLAKGVGSLSFHAMAIKFQLRSNRSYLVTLRDR